MRRLILFRHAKSSWSDPTLADHDRPLSKRGKRDAPVMARFLRERGFVPARIICSTAVRTRETLRLALPGLLDVGVPAITFSGAIYEAPVDAILQAVARADRDDNTVMIVGHNPGLEDVAGLLIGAGRTQDRARLAAKFPSAAVAVIDFEAQTWSRLRPHSGTLVAFAGPKFLTGGNAGA